MATIHPKLSEALDKCAAELLDAMKTMYGADLGQYSMYQMLDVLNVEDELKDRMSSLLNKPN